MSTNITYKMLSRKPSKWLITDGVGSATVTKNSDPACPRCERWYLSPRGITIRHRGGKSFSSRRAAFCYFRTGGEKFITHPVFAKHGRNRGARIR